MKQLLGRLSGTYRAAHISSAKRLAADPPLTPNQLVEAGLVHHRAGRLRDAEALYGKALAADADHFDALHLLGVIQQQTGDSAKAVEWIERAIAIAPEDAFAHSNLGLAYLELGRLDQAETVLRKAVALRPDWDSAHNNLGTVLQARGRVGDAEACFKRATELNPSNTEALTNLGSLGKERGQVAEAEQFYRKALAIDAATPGTWKNLGQVFQQTQRLSEAAACYQKALELKPNDANVLNEIGSLHEARGELAEAERCFSLALKFDSNLVEAMCNLGHLLRRLDRLDEAESYCRQALAVRPADLVALNNLAATLLRASALDEAERCCRQALSLQPDYVPALTTMGIILGARDRPAEAEACFRRAMRLSPASAPAMYNLSVLKLLRGDYREGFELYESRFDALRWDIGCPPKVEELLQDDRRWHGESISGRRLLIWAEQGFGDSLMMLRYLPLLRGRGATHISVQCAASLRRLVGCVSGLDENVTWTEAASADEFDLHCPMMSLPFLFHTTLESIPDRVPYLAIPSKLADTWKERLSRMPKIKVGLAWAGSRTLRDDTKRSVPLSAFEPVIRSGVVRLLSLQKGSGSEQVAQWRGQVEDWMDDCHDFMDTAALVHNLDLVISVDSAMAHLAGALGKPVWLLNRYRSEWRWGLQSERSPWYPSMRIFRQQACESWEQVISRVATELTRFQAP